MKAILKRLMEITPYEIVRRNEKNRFQALESILVGLRKRGFAPPEIFDCGANTGAFACEALEFFPESIVHLVEPQPGCHPILRSLVERNPQKLRLHPFALGSFEQDGQYVWMSTDEDSKSTGAHVVLSIEDSAASRISVACRAIDNILGDSFGNADGNFLKLDLQGFELQAMKGATRTLSRSDVVLCEVSFFAQAYEPPISELVAFLDHEGFQLYDIASVSSRRRDGRARQGDFVFVKRTSPLAADTAWA